MKEYITGIKINTKVISKALKDTTLTPIESEVDDFCKDKIIADITYQADNYYIYCFIQYYNQQDYKAYCEIANKIMSSKGRLCE